MRSSKGSTGLRKDPTINPSRVVLRSVTTSNRNLPPEKEVPHVNYNADDGRSPAQERKEEEELTTDKSILPPNLIISEKPVSLSNSEKINVTNPKDVKGGKRKKTRKNKQQKKRRTQHRRHR